MSEVGVMQEVFRLGIFTSATQRTTRNVLPLLEQAAGPGPPLFSDASLILHRLAAPYTSNPHSNAPESNSTLPSSGCFCSCQVVRGLLCCPVLTGRTASAPLSRSPAGLPVYEQQAGISGAL